MSRACPKPDCDYEGPEHGVKVHFGKTHEGTIGKTSSCETCGRTYRVTDGKPVTESRFCSLLCKKVDESKYETRQGLARGKWNRCKQCGEWAKAETFCSADCQASWREETGVMRGESSPRWRGGETDRYWMGSETVEAVLDRDGKCQTCGLSNNAHKVMTGNRLHIHHMKPRRKCSSRDEANEITNLILLCSTCHQRLENSFWNEQTGV